MEPAGSNGVLLLVLITACPPVVLDSRVRSPGLEMPGGRFVLNQTLTGCGLANNKLLVA